MLAAPDGPCTGVDVNCGEGPCTAECDDDPAIPTLDCGDACNCVEC
ncbi:hypothetical protein [Paraliomyxa miuraensis]|nr:hypothetical protein [Paraliomyxa miuraensis]MCX4239304.1 hypothetical protein [Paraliomyxa miuraensis]